MPQEKQNKVLQQKLDELSTLPAGVDFNAGVAWQKLEKELNPALAGKRNYSPGPTGRRDMYSVKWVAVAAVLFGVIGTIWFLNVDTTSEVVAKIPHSKPEVTKEKSNSTAVKEEAPDAFSTANSVITFEAGNNVKHSVKQKIVLEKREMAKQPFTTPSSVLSEGSQTDNVLLTKDLPIEKTETRNPNLETVSVSPVRKFRIVHVNETLPPRVETARNYTTPNTGFPFYKQPAIADNTEETMPNIPEQPQRKKEWGLIKTLTNSIKD